MYSPVTYLPAVKPDYRKDYLLRKQLVNSKSFLNELREEFRSHEQFIYTLENRLGFPSIVSDGLHDVDELTGDELKKLGALIGENYLKIAYDNIRGYLAANLAWQRKRNQVTVKSIFPIRELNLFIEYSDGEFREFSMDAFLGYISEHPLAIWENFRQAFPFENTVAWPDGSVMDPEYLYTNSRGM